MKIVFFILICITAAIASYNTADFKGLISSLVYTSHKANLTSATNPTTTFQGLPLIPSSHQTTTNISIPRPIRQGFLAIEQSEGVGAHVRTPSTQSSSETSLPSSCSTTSPSPPAPASPTTRTGVKKQSYTFFPAVPIIKTSLATKARLDPEICNS